MNNSNAEQFHNEYNTDEKNIQQLDPFECMLIDVAQKGLKSEYWEKVIPYQWHGNPTSSVNQMYVAGLVYGFHDSEIMRLIGEKAQELQIVFEKTSFWYWLEFFAERHEKRPKIKPKNEKETDVFRHGIYSQYWEEFTHGLPWESKSSEAKLYVIAKIYGLNQSEILAHIEEQKKELGNSWFAQQGFFAWRDFLERIRENQVEPEQDSQEFDVLLIPYEYYRTAVLNDKNIFGELFSDNGTLDEEWLKNIHFNATHSMVGSMVSHRTMLGFIRGTLIGCIGSGKETLAIANDNIRRSSKE